MRKLELINVQGKIYNILAIYGGNIFLGNPYGLNNDIVREGTIWEMQPFNEKIPKAKYYYYSVIRFFKFFCFNSK